MSTVQTRKFTMIVCCIVPDFELNSFSKTVKGCPMIELQQSQLYCNYCPIMFHHKLQSNRCTLPIFASNSSLSLLCINIASKLNIASFDFWRQTIVLQYYWHVLVSVVPSYSSRVSNIMAHAYQSNTVHAESQ